MQQSQGHDLTRPEVGLRMFGDGAHLRVYLVEQGRDKVYGAHADLLSGEGCHPNQRGGVVGQLQAQKCVLLVLTDPYLLRSL
jgi:hypothetical protein